MNWSRVKTILIVCLLAVNAVLLSVYLVREGQTRQMERENQEHLRQVLLRQGVTVSDTAVLPDSQPQGREVLLQRDGEQERRLARTLLGEDGLQEDGDVYTGTAGTLRFRGGGYLELSGSGELSVQAVREALGAEETALEEGTLSQFYEGCPVYNSGLTLSGGQGTAVLTGRWVMGTPAGESRQGVHSAATILLRYAERYGQERPTVEAVELGYMVQAAAPGYLRLTPVWRIMTDQGDVYFSAVTGEEETLG